jgi:hypothetical protein
MFKIMEIVKTANEAVAKIVQDLISNLPEINLLIYAPATVITAEINGRGSYKSETQSPKHPRGLDRHRRV